MKKIIIYTTNNCGYCNQAKALFKSKGLEYKEINVSGDTAKQQEMISLTGQYSVPVITIDGKIVLGFNREKISEYLGN